ncbi:replication initiation protein [Rubrivirga sp. S365]|uniref:replication initiation protein n=1 Tax=Rubrivirga sp. S365 TaxID=3076080 RepID=UPI0028C93E14|nr:replication initiation protein [Rubrivirga sp. S365]MDT7858189.1 replication initiation protein [Rubrivirga sp. S365]
MAQNSSLELKKHVGAVHVKGVLSLVERKTANALLLNAYHELPDESVTRHEILLSQLARDIGLNSKNTEHLKDALGDLVDRKVEWNALDRDGVENWGTSTLLAAARIPEGSGVCLYQYSSDLRELLYNPRVYARINLGIQTLFTSQYAIALYENCLRFLRVGSTGWLSVEEWRGLLGVGEGQYATYKKFRQRVLSPAVDQVNAIGHIHVEMHVRKSGRRVVALRFDVRPGRVPASLLEDAGDDGADIGVSARLLDLGVSRDLVDDLKDHQVAALSRVEVEQVARNVAHVRGELARGKAISNPLGYLYAAITRDYAAGSSAQPDLFNPSAVAELTAAEPSPVPAGEARRRSQEDEENRRVDERIEGLDADGLAALNADAVGRLQERGHYSWRQIDEAVSLGLTGQDLKGALGAILYGTLRAERRDVMRGRAL